MSSILFKHLGDDPSFPRRVLGMRDVAIPVLAVAALFLWLPIEQFGLNAVFGGVLVAMAYSAVALPALRYLTQFGWWALVGGVIAGGVAGWTYRLLFHADLGPLNCAGLGAVAGLVLTPFQLLWIVQVPVPRDRDGGAA
jgi:membrane associated rhomboid family serine protease